MRLCACFPDFDVIYHILFVDLVAMPEGPHPIPFRTRSLSLPGPMVLRLKARESRSPPGLLKGCNRQDPSSRSLIRRRYPLAAKFDAGWSSPVARQAHNLKVIGSNPIPAPKLSPADQRVTRGLPGFPSYCSP